MRKGIKSARVKRDYLIRLDTHWYRGDTNSGHIARDARLQEAPSVFSSANSDATLSRERISTARPPSIITSQGRGREL